MRRVSAFWAMLIAVCAAAPAGATYSFSVPKMLLSVYVNPDASITMEYEITFACNQGAQPVDIVDVGLPHKGYDISNMSAALNDVPLSGIKNSTYIDTGVEVPLGGQAIGPGQTGVFTFKCTMPSMIYQDTTRKDYASLRITPTWFDADLLTGTTDLGIVIYLPKDIKPEELLHHGQAFTAKGSVSDYTMAAWYLPGVRVDGPHMVGISFPKRVMERVIKMTVFGLFMKWWREHPNVRFGWAALAFVLFGIMFFRATQGTGVSVFVFLVIVISILFVVSPGFELLALPGLLPIWYLCEKQLKRRKGKYLPAIASVEGGGIKRGLTAPEAAVILELPLNRVLTLVIFGLLKKGILRQVQADPLKVEVAPEYVGLSRRERRKKAREAGTVIRGYEQPFIEAIQATPGRLVRDINFGAALRECVRLTAKRMEGFDLERTRNYYRSIVSRAWAEANAIGEIEQRTEYTDDNLLWLLVADDYADRFGYWHTRGYYYRAPWGRTADAGIGAPTQTPVGGTTSVQDVSASFAGWAENVTGSVASSMDPVSIGLRGGGIVNLSGADRVTLNVLESLAQSSGSGGGGGCACAGCACACACAGGGR